MIINNKGIIYSFLFLFIIYIVFPISVYSLSSSPSSPPQSPDWDALLSVPIHQGLFGNLLSSPTEGSSNNQAIDKSISRTDVGTTDHVNMQNQEMMEKHKIANIDKKPKYANLPEEERQKRLSEQKKKKAEYQRQRRKELKEKPKQPNESKYANLPEEERQERLLKERNKRAEYQRQRRKNLQKPENAEKLKEMNKRNSRRNQVYRHNLIVEVQSENASQERVETYLRRKEADRKRQKRKYAKLQAKRS